MQTDLAHEAVHEECGARHVSRVFEQTNEKKQKTDLRKEYDHRAYACPYLADLDQSLCNQGSPWACNEAGLMHIALSRSGEDARRSDPRGAAPSFQQGCELGLDTACRNTMTLTEGSDHFAPSQPTLHDLPILLRGGKGEVREKGSTALLALACKQGWPNTCLREH